MEGFLMISNRKKLLLAALIALTGITAISAAKRGADGQDPEDNKHVNKKRKVDEKEIKELAQKKEALESLMQIEFAPTLKTELEKACKQYGPDMVNQTIAYYDIGEKRFYNITLLHKAAGTGNANCVTVLCQHNANVDQQAHQNFTPLHLAVIGKSPICIRILCQHKAKLNQEDASGATPLFCAAENGDIECVNTLLEFGADANKKNKGEDTLLHRSVKYPNILEKLLEHKASVNALDADKQTVLHNAALFETFQSVEILCRWHAKVDEPNSTGCTPLHYAARYTSNQKIVETLCTYNAKTNATNNEAKTPLHLAIEYGRVSPECVRRLILFGADPTIKDKDLKLAKDYVVTWEPEFEKYLSALNQTPVGLIPKRKNEIAQALDKVFSPKELIAIIKDYDTVDQEDYEELGITKKGDSDEKK